MHLQFNPLLMALSAAIILSTPVSSQVSSYEGFPSTVSCNFNDGTFDCSDGGAVWCSLPTGFGFSVQFDNLPAGTRSQGYTGSTCSAFLFFVFGPGTRCWNGGGARATHMNWFHSPSGAEKDIDTRAATEPATNFSAPAYFKCKNDTGARKTIKVPTNDPDAAETIAKLFSNKAFNVLATYEEY